MFCWACDERHWSMGWIKPSRRRLLNKMPLFLRRDKSKLAETILWNGSQSSYFLSYICRKEYHENGLFFCWEQSTHIPSSLHLHYTTRGLVVLFSTKCLSVLLFRKILSLLCKTFVLHSCPPRYHLSFVWLHKYKYNKIYNFVENEAFFVTLLIWGFG